MLIVNTSNNTITYNNEAGPWLTGQVYTAEAVNALESAILLLNTNIGNIETIVGNTTISDTLTNLISAYDPNRIRDQINSDINNVYQNTIKPAIDETISSAESRINNAISSAEAAASQAVIAANSATNAVQTEISSLTEAIYGSTTPDNGTSDSLKAWINTQLTTLQTAVNESIQPSITAINTQITSLHTTDSELSSSISVLYDSIFGNGEAGSKTIQEQITELNEAIFGGEVGSNEYSLIDKIEENLGRPLDGDYIGIDENQQPYDNSFNAKITKIENILGLNGEISQEQNSSLIDLVNTLINAIYGTTDITSTEIEGLENSLATLENTFYHLSVNNGEEDLEQSIPTLVQTLYPIVYEVQEANEGLESAISSYSAAVERSLDSFIDATTTTLGNNNYLILQRDVEAGEAPNEEAIENGVYNNNTYIILPKGGGGGGETYPYFSVFDVDRPAGTPIIAKGSNYIIRYKWITKDITTTDESTGLPGTLRLYKNDILLYTIAITSVSSISSYSELDVTNYIDLGVNNFKIVVVSDNTASKNFYYTIESVEPKLTSSFNPEIIQNNDNIVFSFTMSIGNASINKNLYIYIDDDTEPQVLSSYSRTSERIQTVTFATPANGGHLLRVYFTSTINGETITSNILTYGIICGVLNQTYIGVDFIPNTRLEQYSNLVLNYLARTPNTDNTPIEITITDGSDHEYTRYTTVAHTSYEQWSYALNIPMDDLEETRSLIIKIRANSSDENMVQIPFILVKNAKYDFSPITTGLKLYLTADQKSNTSTDYNIWENTSPAQDAATGIIPILSNFLYYKDVDGWQRDSDNKYYLKLRNKARVEIPFSIFSENITSEGMTFEIEFKTEDVLNYDTICLACCDKLGENSFNYARGIILSPQNSRFQVSTSSETISTGNENEEALTTTNILSAYYKEEEKMTIAFVINPISGNSNSKVNSLMYIYINGILSGATPYTSIGTFDNGRIIIGSDKCTTDIYSIRCYSRALDYREILQNWISNEGNFEERAKLYEMNTYTAADDTELFEQFKLKSSTTPYMVIMAKGDLNDSVYMPIQKGSEHKKPAHFYFYDPLDENNNIGAISANADISFSGVDSLRSQYGLGEMEVQVQGTSSQYYYRKNYKLKFSSFTQDGTLHKKKYDDSDYDIEYGEPTINPETGEETPGTEISRTLKPDRVKTGYKLSSTSYPTWTFCIKADVASSESANNTLLTMLYDEVSRHFYLTPPQEKNSSIRQGVEGRPVVAWYYNTTTSKYTLLGKYNFNNDKGTHDVFGLEGSTATPWSGDQSWEVKNNGGSLLTLFSYTDSNLWNKWYEGFEARFPDQDDTLTELTSSKEPANLTTEDRDKWIAGLKEVVEWVNNTVTLTAITSGHDAEATNESVTAFKAHFEDYFNKNAMLFFYVFTEFFLMVDNRAKNMFLTRYLLSENRTTNYGSNTLTSDGTNTANYFGWFTFPYDFDTALGIDNNGRIRFDYHYEDTDLQPDGTSVIFNGQRSKLWKAFEKAYKNEIKDTYTQFSNYLNYNYLETQFEKHQSVWSAAIFNEDMIHKYIDWGNAYLYMLLGSKESHRKWWLSNRFRYFNSKYQIGKDSDRIYLRVAPGSYSLGVSTYADSYINIEIGANGIPQTTRTLRGTQQTLSYEADESQSSSSSSGIDGIETIIYPASALNSITGIASLRAREADFSHASKLEMLKLGSPLTTNENLSLLTLGQNAILRYFDMRNYSGYRTTLNLSNYISLERVYLGGSSIPTVDLPNGGILKTVQYPTTITTIKIENQPYLENLIIGNALPANEREDDDVTANVPIFTDETANNYSNITGLYLDNVGIVDEANHINLLDSAYIVGHMDANGHLYLNNFIWNMTTTEFKTLYDRIILMKGFTDGNKDANVKAYISGTVYLTGDMPEGFSVNDINTAFEGRVKVYHTDSQGTHEYHTITYRGLNNEVLLTELVAGVPENKGDAYFTEEYITEYNTNFNVGWQDGDTTRIGFDGRWQEVEEGTFSFSSAIQTDIELHPIKENQSRMNYVMLTENPGETVIAYKYYTINKKVNAYYENNEAFIRNYYQYRHRHWTDNGTNYNTREPDDIGTEGTSNYRGPVSSFTKTANVDYLYEIYRKDAAQYNVNIYNMDILGNPVYLGTISNKTVVSTIDSSTNRLTVSELDNYNPTINKSIFIGCAFNETGTDTITTENSYVNDKAKNDNNRKYRFLSWKPYISYNEPLSITGNMNIYLTYYCVDDLFTNYFLNKIETCTLPNTITSLPEGAFFHNSNLRKITMNGVANVGKYGFCNQDQNSQKIYIFDKPSGDIYIEENAFSYLNNSIIIFKTTGQIYVYQNAFSYITNCSILIPNSLTPIKMINNSASQAFYQFVGTEPNNKMYITTTAFNNIRTSGVPNSLNPNNYQESIYIGKTYTENTTDGIAIEIHNLLEGANLSDIEFSN